MGKEKITLVPSANTRRRRTAKSHMSDSDKFSVIRDYMSSELTVKEIAEKYQTTTNNVELIVSRHWKSLTNVREAKILMNNQGSNYSHKNGNYHALKAIGKVPTINSDFLSLLSDPDDDVLTDQELQYCFNYIATGDNFQALTAAGLHEGIMGSKSDKQKNQYEFACRLRGNFLRQKPNVAKYLQHLKEQKYIPEIIDKKFVQRELLEQLHQLKESTDSPTVRAQTLKTIEMIGRSVGAFSDVVRIEEVDPAEALDYLNSLASANTNMITHEHVIDN